MSRGDEDVPGPALEDLDLVAVREYRRTLMVEEDRVSYWRRLVQARVDVLRAQSPTNAGLTAGQLARVLGDTSTGVHRQALARVHGKEPLPALPELEALWSVDTDPRDEAATAEALAALDDVEARLAGYRRALHGRLEQVTDRLIELYRLHPSAALDLLPKA